MATSTHDGGNTLGLNNNYKYLQSWVSIHYLCVEPVLTRKEYYLKQGMYAEIEFTTRYKKIGYYNFDNK